MKYALVTFGCRVNQADSLEIEGALRARGGVPAAPAQADLVVVNTCSVTATADQGARQVVRKIARENPGAQIVVTGCYATRRPHELGDLPGVVAVVPNDHKDGLVDSLPWPTTTASRDAGGDGPCGARLTPGVAGRTAFTLRVQTGCDEHCSYCIIPSTRGVGRSRPFDWVLRAVDEAVAAGYKEIALCGVHLGSYGRDLPDGSSLADLVRRLSQWPAEVLFRISSLEPMDFTPELLEIAATSARIAPHFHLPLQHADDAMLRAMRRPYTAAAYERLVGEIATSMPDACIGTDVIAGFPGETDAQADALAEGLVRLPLSYVHVFPYSDRPGTEASGMDGKVDGGAIRARGARLRAIGSAHAERFRAAQVGRVRRALVVDDGTSVVTDNYLKLALDEPRTRNEWVDVRVEGPHQGRVVDKAQGSRPKAECPVGP
ncbi:MAG TPA: tRNA (N(6)-L-threonylcarbamoyladenosine(37)-C(2))-methylthiotransferase MtaB [Vicinamibacterales bacterium]